MAMKNTISKALGLFVILMTLNATATQAAQSVRVIRNDSGGQLQQYLNALSIAAIAGEVIKIDGWCASACTVYLGSPFTCVTPQAKFGFHAPFGGTAEQNRYATQVMASNLPPVLGRWFLQNAAHLGGQQYVALSGAQIVQMGASRYC